MNYNDSICYYCIACSAAPLLWLWASAAVPQMPAAMACARLTPLTKDRSSKKKSIFLKTFNILQL